MQALKAVVIILGVLIVIGMGIFAYGVAVKFGGMADADKTPAETASVEAWGDDTRAPVPAGAEVRETVVGEGRIVVRLALPAGGERLLVFDLATGRRLGAIDLVPAGGER